MNGLVGCIGLVGIAVFIALLFVRRKKIESGMTDFYKEHSLFTTENVPRVVRESLGASDNLYCCRANLTTAAGETIEFCWWEWYLKSSTMVNGVPSASFANYLAVSFAPDSVSDEFAQKAFAAADKSHRDVSQKFKDFFVTNTETPYRAEKLADGSLLICWRVLKRRDVLEAKIAWLKNNITLPVKAETVAPKVIKAKEVSIAPPIKAAAPPKNLPKPFASTVMEITFYKHENYAAVRQKFESAWTNLTLELHHNSGKFDKEGYDELEIELNFVNPDIPQEAFTLTDETAAEKAETLFEQEFGGHALILRDYISVERRESLAYCNNPFRLPLNKYTYGEFKRRFTERWTNLAIELYDTAPHEGGLWANSRELKDDFEMANLKNADKAYLHDYAYISDWGRTLKDVRVAAMFRNDALNIYCEDNLKNLRLRDFNELKKA